MNLLEKVFGTLKTESDVTLSADKSLFVFAVFVVVLALAVYTVAKKKK